MPISPTDLAAIRNPPPPPDVVSADDQATYATIPPFVDAQLQSVTIDPLGYYPVVIPASQASVLLAHPSLVQALTDAYSEAGWRIAQAAGQHDGTFALTLAPPTGRSGPVAL